MMYGKNVIYTTCGSIIPLKFVESISFDKTDEDLMIDKLMDDFCGNIRTVSGQDYRISIKQIARRADIDGFIHEIVQAILDKWMFIHREN